MPIARSRIGWTKMGNMQYSVQDAKTQFSRLLDLVAQGESIVIARNGVPIAEIVPYSKNGIQLGAGVSDPSVNQALLETDYWWRAMSDEAADDFLEGR
jgi:prevent-host-death family protein